ncbi:unnamed protein product, partial [Phaeothamnion confervicola]
RQRRSCPGSRAARLLRRRDRPVGVEYRRSHQCRRPDRTAAQRPRLPRCRRPEDGLPLGFRPGRRRAVVPQRFGHQRRHPIGYLGALSVRRRRSRLQHEHGQRYRRPSVRRRQGPALQPGRHQFRRRRQRPSQCLGHRPPSVLARRPSLPRMSASSAASTVRCWPPPSVNPARPTAVAPGAWCPWSAARSACNTASPIRRRSPSLAVRESMRCSMPPSTAAWAAAVRWRSARSFG